MDDESGDDDRDELISGWGGESRREWWGWRNESGSWLQKRWNLAKSSTTRSVARPLCDSLPRFWHDDGVSVAERLCSVTSEFRESGQSCLTGCVRRVVRVDLQGASSVRWHYRHVVVCRSLYQQLHHCPPAYTGFTPTLPSHSFHHSSFPLPSPVDPLPPSSSNFPPFLSPDLIFPLLPIHPANPVTKSVRIQLNRKKT